MKKIPKTMDSEEKYIKEKIGNSNPFVVPEGYFDQLAANVMAQLPERKAKSRRVSLRPLLYAAACVVAVVVMALSYLFNKHAADTEQPVAVSSVDNTYIEEAADYVMLDNNEIYACLEDY